MPLLFKLSVYLKEDPFRTVGNIVELFEDWSYVNILDTKSQSFLCCTSS